MSFVANNQIEFKTDLLLRFGNDVDGAAGRKILKPAALPAEFPRLFLCYEICGEMSEKVDVQSNFITGTVFADFFHRR